MSDASPKLSPPAPLYNPPKTPNNFPRTTCTSRRLSMPSPISQLPPPATLPPWQLSPPPAAPSPMKSPLVITKLLSPSRMLQIWQLPFPSYAKNCQFDRLPTFAIRNIVGLEAIFVTNPVVIVPPPLLTKTPCPPNQTPKADSLKINPTDARRELPNIRTSDPTLFSPYPYFTPTTPWTY